MYKHTTKFIMRPYRLNTVFEFCRKVTVSKRWGRRSAMIKLSFKPEQTKSSCYCLILILVELPLILS